MSVVIKKVAIVGGGVNGGGWAARLMLNGIDVKVFDPSAIAGQTLREMLANAKRAYSKLTMAPLVEQGKLTPVIHKVLPFSQIEEAHRLLENRESLGKIVLSLEN